MARTAKIVAGDVELTAEFDDSQTAEAIWNELPIEARGSRWGDEIYFTMDKRISLENPQEVLEIGDLAYWPPGPAFCIFFGPTPASTGDEPRAASAVSRFGRITGDATLLRSTPSSVKVRVEKA